MINAAVLGSPISHSLSPRLHAAAYKFLNIKGTYTSFDVPSGSLQNFLSNKDSEWTGFSLTMPLKEEALSCADIIDPLVQKIRSGNTLLNQDGKWSLFSTDVLGFKNAVSTNNVNAPSSVLIIGSGATARAAVAAFDSSNTTIYVLHRNSERENSIRQCAQSSSITFLPWEFTADIYNFDLVVNTTPKYAIDDFAQRLSRKPTGTYFDVIYDPWPTNFAYSWAHNGGNVIEGLDLLIAQGIEQIRIFTGAQLPTAELTSYLKSELKI